MATSASAGRPPVSGRSWQTMLLLFSKPQHLDKFLVSCFLLFTHIFQSRQRPAQRPNLRLVGVSQSHWGWQGLWKWAALDPGLGLTWTEGKSSCAHPRCSFRWTREELWP